MKKQYISPEAVCEQMLLDSLLETASITSITSVDKGDLEHQIGLGGDADDGAASDSRRYRVWNDEDY